MRVLSAASRRRSRAIHLAILVGLGLYLAAKAVVWFANQSLVADLVGYGDHSIYMAAADRIWAGGPLYPAWELAGLYDVGARPELYPPTTVVGLILPMSRLPAALWWVVPIAIITVHVVRSRPSLGGWVLVLMCLAAPRSWIAIASGGLVLWAAAAVSLGARHGWPAAAVLMKPTLAPFSLLGARSRAWWIALGAGLIVSALLLPFWSDYLVALANFRDPRGLLYSVEELPLMALPLVAWYTGSARPMVAKAGTPAARPERAGFPFGATSLGVRSTGRH